MYQLKQNKEDILDRTIVCMCFVHVWSQLSWYKTCLSALSLVKEHFIGMFVKLLIEGRKKRILPPPPLSPSHQVRKTSEHSPLPATFAHCPHSSPETQYLTIDKQLTHLFFWGTRWLAPSSTLPVAHSTRASWDGEEQTTLLWKHKH